MMTSINQAKEVYFSKIYFLNLILILNTLQFFSHFLNVFTFFTNL